MGHRVAERHKKVILRVVTALIERAGFAHQTAKRGDVLLREVAEDPPGPRPPQDRGKMLRRNVGCQFNLFEVFASRARASRIRCSRLTVLKVAGFCIALLRDKAGPVSSAG